MDLRFKHTNIIVRNMCEVAGVDFKYMDFTKKDWFLKHEWTLEQEKKFENWMVDYLYKNKKAREEIMMVPLKNKSHIKKVVRWFLFYCGWRTKEVK